MKRVLLTAIAILSISIANSQIKNEKEFLNFSKTEFGTKPKFLSDNGWALFIPKNTSVDGGVKTESYGYKKNYNGNSYRLGIERLTSTGSTVVISKTTAILPNGTIFDNWVDGFERLGYVFKNSGTRGELIAGGNGIMISAKIEGINLRSSEWTYVITIITDKKK